MRVLVAYDGSPEAVHALALTASLPWPKRSRVRVVTVAEEPDENIPMPTALEQPASKRWTTERGVLADAQTLLAQAGVDVEGDVLVGRPAAVLLKDAADFGADLIMCGARGRGAVATVLIGSVSLELVDRSRCPVLVARRPTVQRIVLATDGSPSALAAESLLATWLVFSTLPVHIVSVAYVPAPLASGIAPTMVGEALLAHGADLDAAFASHSLIAEAAAARLREVGHAVVWSARFGDAASEIVGVADNTAADLVVVGSRGQTGLKRLVTGSVARGVLHHAATSVLVVHAAAAGADPVSSGAAFAVQ